MMINTQCLKGIIITKNYKLVSKRNLKNQQLYSQSHFHSQLFMIEALVSAFNEQTLIKNSQLERDFTSGTKSLILSFCVVTISFFSLFLFIKIFKAIKKGKFGNSTFNLSISDQNINEIQDQQVNELQLSESYLSQLQQEFLNIYSFYKQLLYLKTNSYHGTNLTSIFVMLNKQSPKSNSENESFQDKSLNFLRTQIKVKIDSMVQKVSGWFLILQKGELKLKNQNIKESIFVNNQIKSCDLRISRLLKYNIVLRKEMKSLEQKIDNLVKTVQILEENQSEKQSIEIIRSSISLITEIKQFLNFIVCSFLKSSESITNSPSKQKQSLSNKIQQIHERLRHIFRSENQQNSLEKQEISSNSTGILRELYQLFLSFVDNKKISTFNQKKFQAYRQNEIQILDEEISSLQVFSDSIKNKKHKIQEEMQIYKQKIEQTKNNSNCIKIYGTSQKYSFRMTSQQEISLQKVSESETFQKQTQITFSSQNKLSFIKQLDKLMIRNRIKKQIQERQKRMKEQQEQDRANQLQSQEDSVILLSKI